MPARPAPTSFVIPGRFHPGWSLLGRALRRATGDRLRAEALHVMLLTGGALAWLMGVYAAEALGRALAWSPLALGAALGGAGLVLALVGGVGVRPRAVVTCEAEAVRIERGRERLRLRYTAVARAEAVAPRVYHRHYRRYAAVRPFLGGRGHGDGAVLLLHMREGPSEGLVAALGLREEQRHAIVRRIEGERRARRPQAAEVVHP